MDAHSHGPDGAVIYAESGDAVPAVAEVETTETVADAEVSIAEINAARDVKLAQTDVKRTEVYASEELAELRGELRGLREVVEALKPSEPEPVPAPAPPVIIEDEPEPVPAETENKPQVGKPKSKSFWF